MPTFSEFIKDKPCCYPVESGFAIWEVKNPAFLQGVDFPEVHIQIFVISGWMEVLIDHQSLTIRRDTLADIIHSRISVRGASPDVVVLFVMTTEPFLAEFIKNKPPFPVSYVMQVLSQPVMLLTHEQSLAIRGRLNLLLQVAQDRSHCHQAGMVKCALWMVFMEMSNVFKLQDETPVPPEGSDRKQYLFTKFIKMLPLHVKQERGVAYYASQLCVSCQYLERVVRLISGQTAGQWIQRSLKGEINHLLRDTDMTMQQIARETGFPDQASFTRYYKRYSQMTPTDFRTKDRD